MTQGLGHVRPMSNRLSMFMVIPILMRGSVGAITPWGCVGVTLGNINWECVYPLVQYILSTSTCKHEYEGNSYIHPVIVNMLYFEQLNNVF